MKIVCLGGGPAGLYFSILAKKANPSWDVTVIERNRPDDTFGWGVVFSDKTMDGFKDVDPETHSEITRAFRHWDDIDVFFKGRKLTSGGHGFCGIGRIKLLQILQKRAAGLGAKLIFQTEVTDPDLYAADYDLVIASDGGGSVTRRKYESIFKPNIQPRHNRFIWLGSKKKLDAFTFDFANTEWGWFNLHAYRFDADWSTFIVETPEKNWLKAGIDKMEQKESIALCEKLFADRLDGNALISNATHLKGSAVWLKFNRILCEKWFHKNIVLIGDAAHTAHFSIGSGTKLAMEDAIALSRVLSKHDGDVAKCAAEVSGRARNRSSETAKRRAKSDGMVRAGRAVRSSRPGTVHLQPPDGQPANRARKSEAARFWIRRDGRELVCRAQRRRSRRSTDVHAVPSARLVAEESSDRITDGDVHGRGWHAERFSSRSFWCASHGRRRDGVHGNDLRFARRAHHSGVPWNVERRAA